MTKALLFFAAQNRVEVGTEEKSKKNHGQSMRCVDALVFGLCMSPKKINLQSHSRLNRSPFYIAIVSLKFKHGLYRHDTHHRPTDHGSNRQSRGVCVLDLVTNIRAN